MHIAILGRSPQTLSGDIRACKRRMDMLESAMRLFLLEIHPEYRHSQFPVSQQGLGSLGFEFFHFFQNLLQYD